MIKVGYSPTLKTIIRTWSIPDLIVSSLFSIFCLSACQTVFAQADQAKPDNAPIAQMGAISLKVESLNESISFWESLGATRSLASESPGVAIPGALIFLSEGHPKHPSTETSINHIGIRVKDGTRVFELIKARGLKIEPTPLGCASTGHNCGFFYTSDGLRVEVYEDPTLAAPIAFEHIHFFVPFSIGTAGLQDWYAKTFGGNKGVAGATGKTLAVTFPGVSLRFAKAEAAVLPSVDGAIDSLILQVKDLRHFCEAQESTQTQCFNQALGAATIVDPNGTTIKLRESMQARTPRPTKQKAHNGQ